MDTQKSTTQRRQTNQESSSKTQEASYLNLLNEGDDHAEAVRGQAWFKDLVKQMAASQK